LLHLFRACSVDVIHTSFELAIAACAADTIAKGILDFIVFGNGRMASAEKQLLKPQQDDTTSAAPPVTFILQSFFKALPCPLSEPVDDKTLTEINAPSWLNTLIQSAHGGKLEHKFICTNDTKLGSMSYSFSPFHFTLSNQSMTHVQWVKKLSQCLAVLERLAITRATHGQNFRFN
jgi:hypothetical protein